MTSDLALAISRSDQLWFGSGWSTDWMMAVATPGTWRIRFGARGHAGFGKVAETGDGRVVWRNAGEGVEFGHEGTAAVDRRLERGCGDRLGNGDILTRLVEFLLGFLQALGDIGAARSLSSEVCESEACNCST